MQRSEILGELKLLMDMEGDFGLKSLEKENECLKQTIYRLSLDLKSQQQAYEGEISYFKNLIDKHLKNLTQIEKTKHDLQSKIKFLNGQLTESTEELGRKTQEIEKLKAVIEKQKAYVFHVDSVITAQKEKEDAIQKESFETRKLNEEFKTVLSNLQAVTQELSSRITDQNSRIQENETVINKLQEIVQVQLQQQIKRLYEDVPTNNTSPELEQWKNHIDNDLSQLAVTLNTIMEDQSQVKVQIGSLAGTQSSQQQEIQNVRNMQNDFLKIWLS